MERSFVESLTAKPYANELGILGSMMGNTMIQHLSTLRPLKDGGYSSTMGSQLC